VVCSEFSSRMIMRWRKVCVPCLQGEEVEIAARPRTAATATEKSAN